MYVCVYCTTVQVGNISIWRYDMVGGVEGIHPLSLPHTLYSIYNTLHIHVHICVYIIYLDVRCLIF